MSTQENALQAYTEEQSREVGLPSQQAVNYMLSIANMLLTSALITPDMEPPKEAMQALKQAGWSPAEMDSYRDKVIQSNALAKMLVGREMGIQAMAALQDVDIVKGKIFVRYPQLISRIEAKGYAIEWTERSNTRAALVATHRKDNTKQEFEFSIDDAKMAGLLAGSKPEYNQYLLRPRVMLTARCASEAYRVLGGRGNVYTPEEKAEVLHSTTGEATEADRQRAEVLEQQNNGGMGDFKVGLKAKVEPALEAAAAPAVTVTADPAEVVQPKMLVCIAGIHNNKPLGLFGEVPMSLSSLNALRDRARMLANQDNQTRVVVKYDEAKGLESGEVVTVCNPLAPPPAASATGPIADAASNVGRTPAPTAPAAPVAAPAKAADKYVLCLLMSQGDNHFGAPIEGQVEQSNKTTAGLMASALAKDKASRVAVVRRDGSTGELVQSDMEITDPPTASLPKPHDTPESNARKDAAKARMAAIAKKLSLPERTAASQITAFIAGYCGVPLKGVSAAPDDLKERGLFTIECLIEQDPDSFRSGPEPCGKHMRSRYEAIREFMQGETKREDVLAAALRNSLVYNLDREDFESWYRAVGLDFMMPDDSLAYIRLATRTRRASELIQLRKSHKDFKDLSIDKAVRFIEERALLCSIEAAPAEKINNAITAFVMEAREARTQDREIGGPASDPTPAAEPPAPADTPAGGSAEDATPEGGADWALFG